MFKNQLLTITHDFPIRTDKPIYNGKIRSIYFLTSEDSKRLIKQKEYNISPDSLLAVMIVSDRISAFDCIWHTKGRLNGILGKGAAINSISKYWFKVFKTNGLADNHIVDIPHPLVWIIQKTKPIMIEAICRKFLTGSIWRDYKQGKRKFSNLILPEGLKKNTELPEIIITPSTKGILRGIPGVSETTDANISRKNIEDNFNLFNFLKIEDITEYERLSKKGFSIISNKLKTIGQTFIDTKFEFGYITNTTGKKKLIYIDEVGTPDSSRIWNTQEYKIGNIIELSKEKFRQFLLEYIPDSDLLLNKERIVERQKIACNSKLPRNILLKISDLYLNAAEIITGQAISLSRNPKQEILKILDEEYHLIK
ncbi:phosphoribosylaminoimidazole-succinocarboxamide synthase [Candidatus Photodesmus katoptron]|uniref:phosphoribosylaminoimidazolesuccinocarboxamide synthase n=1 Tax=Candidatus Photodesmus anomalopis TaxID=28176 RepID=UPI0004D5C589|nr:phosphoribosylaminoimidazolesuccinocarboxamide synthase [Candidatus Photodesmus katoptron]KEY90591.1 phosphoribosylaminoimidazole-succinocarboxamide synthase [Candidatus Photodesmus katoptron]